MIQGGAGLYIGPMRPNSITAPRREDVEIGDVIEVPPGADRPWSGRFRVRVDFMSGWGVTGVKVKIDGAALVNRLDEAIETGLAWHQLPGVILHKAKRASG